MESNVYRASEDLSFKIQLSKTKLLTQKYTTMIVKEIVETCITSTTNRKEIEKIIELFERAFGEFSPEDKEKFNKVDGIEFYTTGIKFYSNHKVVAYESPVVLARLLRDAIFYAT